jgi:hypothetical protein
VSSLLLVESDNDRYFIEKLIQHLKLSIEIGQSVCAMTDIECLQGVGNLVKALNEVRWDLYDKVGILVDANSVGVASRLKLVQDAMAEAGISVQPNKANELRYCRIKEVDLAIGITHVDGSGELETLLKTIKSNDSTYADCLQAWRDCLAKKGFLVSNKDFDKFWLNNYLRFDTCSQEERKQVARKCTNESAMKKDIWDLDHPALDELKVFLRLF